MKKIMIILALAVLLGCTPASRTDKELQDESMLMAVLWVQTAAEYEALAHQAYNWARIRLDEALKEEHRKPVAIIADVDETVMNNTLYNAKGIIEKQNYPDDFYDWIAQARGTEVPGAAEFCNYAASQGCTMFYITNRRERGKEGTVTNLQQLGFPNADSAHVLMKTSTSSKEPRRQHVMQDYDVVLLLGDNLVDFIDAGGADLTQRHDIIEAHKAEFGDRFIILPNPMHGSWKKVLYDYQKGLGLDEVKEKYLEHLQTY